jgi:hypothetical protein
MQPSHLELRALLDLHRSSADPNERAYAENVLFEERVGTDRALAYASGLPATLPDIQTWAEAHNDFVARTVHIELPETFTAVNAAAALSADIDRTLHLIRVERIDRALRDVPGLEGNLLALAADIMHGRRTDRTMSDETARDLAATLCDYFNTNPVRSRPKFAGFFHDLRAERIDPPTNGWPDRLRNRLGLAHHDPGDGPPIPVALFRYPVSAVLEAVFAPRNLAHRLTIPTVLDTALNPLFHPAPVGLDFGRAVNLSHDQECDRMTAEVLHLRIDYLPAHLWAVDAIITPPPVAPPSPDGPGTTKLEVLRQTHLFCLKYHSGRDDFGA